MGTPRWSQTQGKRDRRLPTVFLRRRRKEPMSDAKTRMKRHRGRLATHEKRVVAAIEVARKQYKNVPRRRGRPCSLRWFKPERQVRVHGELARIVDSRQCNVAGQRMTQAWVTVAWESHGRYTSYRAEDLFQGVDVPLTA